MRSIKKLISFKLEKEGYEFVGEIENIKDVWGIFLPEYRSKENEKLGFFKLEVAPKLVGMVIQYIDGHYECNLKTIDFQAEHTEEELKDVIISDIKTENDMFSLSSLVGKDEGLKYLRGDEPILTAEQIRLYTNVSEGLSKFTRSIQDSLDSIKKVDDDLTDLNEK